MRPALRIPPKQLRTFCERYEYSAEPKSDDLRASAREQGYLTAKQLHEIVLWKSKRRAALALSNPDGVVREITAFAFSAKYEESRIGALVLLKGVLYPTASVILHFCVSETYPILDYRALWSLGIERPSTYSTDFWLQYVEICRSIAEKHQMSVRELDRALWQYSKEHQRDG